MKTENNNPSAITPIQDSYDKAVEAGKIELIKHFGETNLDFKIGIIQNGFVRIGAEHNDIFRFTIIEYKLK